MPSIVNMLERSEAAGQLLCVDAADLLHGCVRVTIERDGWLRPWRFSAEQVRAMGSCQAWHPGLFRQMARTTSGVSIEMLTDSTEITLEVRLDAEPSGTAAVLDPIRGDEDLPFDGISVDVEERHLACRLDEAEDEDILTFSISDPDETPLPGLISLPGLDEPRHVRICLPALRGCTVRRVWGNGTVMDPVAQREHLLVLGDSIAQGFVAGDPAYAWPALLAKRMGLDAINQGLGGSVFQPGSLFGLASLVNPRLVVVALGENYRFEPCRHRPVARDVRSYLSEVSRLWPDVPTYVCSPLWHDEEASPSHAMSCWRRVPSMVAANAAAHDQMVFVDGMRLLDHDASRLADRHGHPNAEGARQIAERLAFMMRGYDDDQGAFRMRAKAALKGGSRALLPMTERMRLGAGLVRFAEEGCVLLEVGEMPGSGSQAVESQKCLIYAADEDLGRTVVAALVDDAELWICGGNLADAAEKALDMEVVTSYRIATYRRKLGLELEDEQSVRSLDESFLDEVMSHTRPEYADAAWLSVALQKGLVLGGFDNDDLVGWVGEGPDGSVWLPVVFEGHPREGWSYELEGAKVNQVLAAGRRPWCLVPEDARNDLDLQRRLGMSISQTPEVFVMRRTASDADR